MLTLNNLAKRYSKVLSPERYVLDRPIFSLFDSDPLHEDVDVVYAKVALVNRVYRANLNLSGANAEWRVAEKLVKAKKAADSAVFAVREAGRFSRENENVIATAHEQLLDLVSRVTKRDEQSFCSKYLSFHAPTAVPILDQFAYANAWRLVGARFPRGLHLSARNRDFRCHASCVLELIDELRSRGIEPVDVKWLDFVLYSSRA